MTQPTPNHAKDSIKRWLYLNQCHSNEKLVEYYSTIQYYKSKGEMDATAINLFLANTRLPKLAKNALDGRININQYK